MLIFVALLYFCLACSAIWLVRFPTRRASVLQLIGALRVRLDRRLGRWYDGRIRQAAMVQDDAD